MSEPSRDDDPAARGGLWALASRPSVRRDGAEVRPPGPKARRTRSRILAAAAEAFGSAGYQRTTMADVAAAAGVSLGTVYQYFSDRADLVAALVGGAVRRTLDMMAGGSGRAASRWQAEAGLDGLRRVLGGFVESYAAAAPMARVWEEVTHVDDGLADLRRRMGRSFTRAVELELRAAADAGAIRADLDPAITARALTGMVDRYCYVTYVFDPPDGGPPPVPDSVEVLAQLWHTALQAG